MDEEIQESEGTLTHVFRTIFSQKWVALILLVAITAVGTLGIYFGYNHTSTEYVVSFRLNLPKSNALQTDYTYPDGKTLFYGSLIAKSTLEQVKQSNSAYKDIDIDGLVNHNAVHIDESVSVTTVGTQSLVDRVYTLHASARYFPNIDIARQYLHDLASHPRQYLLQMKIEYYGYLKLYNEAYNYEKRIEYLNNQLSFIIQKYRALIADYGADFTVQNAVAIKDYLAETEAYADSHAVTTLKAQLQNNGSPYMMSEADRIAYDYELQITNIQLADAKSVLEAMQQGATNPSVTVESLRAQAQTVADLQRRVTELNNFKENGVVDTDGVFAAILTDVYTTVNDLTARLQSATDTVYQNASAVYFSNANVLTVNGKVGLGVSFGISFAVGLVLSCLVAYIVAKIQNSKKTVKKEEKPQGAAQQ